MADVKIERIAKQLEEGKIVINSTVTENLDKKEFTIVVTNYNTKITNAENAINASRKELEQLKEVELTDELKKFNEMLKLSERLKKKEEIIENLKTHEANLMKLQEESKGIFSLLSELNAPPPPKK